MRLRTAEKLVKSCPGSGSAWRGAERCSSKYHGIFLPIGTALYLVLHRPARRWLSGPGPYAAMAIALLAFSPVIAWNATHEWASFLFQGGRAVGSCIAAPRGIDSGPPGAVHVSVSLDLGAAGGGAGGGLPELARAIAFERFLLALAVAPLGVVAPVACFRPVLPHWGLIGLVSIFPLLGRKWSVRAELRPVLSRRFLAGCRRVFGAVSGVHDCRIPVRDASARQGRSRWTDRRDSRPHPRPLRLGPGSRRDSKVRAGGGSGNVCFHPLLVPEAQLAHSLGGRRPVLCYNADDPRGFAFWSKPDEWIGHDGILVVVGEHEAMARYYSRWFSRVEPVSDFWVEAARASRCGGSASTAARGSGFLIRSRGRVKPD